jgi:hypothetical protein
MPFQATLAIGCINLQACGSRPLMAPESRSPVGADPAPDRYTDFDGGNSRGPGAFDFMVRVEPAVEPPTQAVVDALLADNPGAWSMARDGGGFRLWLPPPTGETIPLWDVRLDDSLSAATIRCGPGLQTVCDGQPALINPLRYPLDQLLLMYALARREGCIVHAAGVVFQGQTWLFPGRSGAGKTTLARLLQADGRFALLSDDRMVVRRIGGALWAFGTPWPGEAGIARNAGAPLGGLFFLRHAAADGVVPLDPRMALDRLLPVASIPWYHADVLPGLLDFVGGVAQDAPAWELAFRPDPSVADAIAAVAATGRPADR